MWTFGTKSTWAGERASGICVNPIRAWFGWFCGAIIFTLIVATHLLASSTGALPRVPNASSGKNEKVATTAAAKIQLKYLQIDAAQFPRIVSYVSVRNDSGLSIAGLTKDNFIVHEDGIRELPIEVVELADDSVGITVVLVMDRSGSMEGTPLEDAKTAATTFVQLMNSKDQAALVSFNNKVTTDQGFTKDKTLLVKAINALQSKGGTAIYDAVIHATDLIATVPGRRALILLTDGADKDSRATFTEAYNKISPLGVPIFTIGLGPNVGAAEEGRLRQLADSTYGHYYYSPTSKELEAIYREISKLLHHLYRITYTTHNCTMDGTVRNVRIDVQYRGMTSFANRTYVAPDHVVTFALAADSLPIPGWTFRLKMEIPSYSKELLNMAELRVTVKYNAQYLKVKQPLPQNISAGSLWGAPADFTLTAANDAPGVLTLYLKRKPGLAPVKGRGIVLMIPFVADPAMPDSTQLKFELANLEPRTDTGCLVARRTEALTLYSNGLIVWPGDTNHNGKVELSDVLILGVYWDLVGPVRPGPEDQLAWMPHLAQRYPIREATHADADGNGGIIERDLIPIGLNWGKVATPISMQKVVTTPARLPEGEMQVTISPATPAGQYRLQLSFAASTDAELAGITFRVTYPSHEVTILSAQPGTAWLDQPLVVTHHNEAQHTFAMGVMMPAGSPLPTNGGNLAELFVQAERQPELSDFVYKDVALVAADGKIRDVTVQTSVGTTSEVLPERFTFYPAYPNPVLSRTGNSSATWRYYLPEKATVKVRIYNATGQEIKNFSQPEAAKGFHILRWDGTDAQGRRVGSGLYFVGIEARGQNNHSYRATQKIAVVK